MKIHCVKTRRRLVVKGWDEFISSFYSKGLASIKLSVPRYLLSLL